MVGFHFSDGGSDGRFLDLRWGMAKGKVEWIEDFYFLFYLINN